MTTTAPAFTHSNPIHIAPLVRWLLVAVAFIGYGLVFVYVKNQQHQLGQATRVVERQIAEERATNEVLLARITTLSSRAALQRKLQQGEIALKPIAQNSIAMLTPPAEAGDDGILRTAAMDPIRP